MNNCACVERKPTKLINAVQVERGPRTKKGNNLRGPADKNVFRPHSHLKLSPASHSLEVHVPSGPYEVAAQLFLATMGQARLNAAICELPRCVQNVLLVHSWSQLFILNAANWPALLIPSDCASDLCQLLYACRQLYLNQTESSLLETLILSRNDVKGVSEIVLRYLTTCYSYTQANLYRYTNLFSPSRYPTLMLVLPALNKFPSSKLKAQIMEPIIGNVPVEHIIGFL